MNESVYVTIVHPYNINNENIKQTINLVYLEGTGTGVG